MTRRIAQSAGKLVAVLVVVLASSYTCDPAFAQTLTFNNVEIRASAPNTMPQMRARFGNGRYELRNATAVDLIRTAWGVEADSISGGPDWLDLNRYDVLATAPPTATPQMLRAMLQGMLATRFQLSVRNGEKDRPAYAIEATKNPHLTAAEGTEAGGCKLQPFRPAPRGTPQPPVTLVCSNRNDERLRQDPGRLFRGLGLRVRLSSSGSVGPARSLEF